MNMRKIAIFDFDGTLADSFPWFISRLNQVARIFRFKEVGDEDIPKLRVMKTGEILNYLNISPWKLPFVVIYFRRLMKKELESIDLFSQTESLLRHLNNKGIEIFVLSSNSEQNVKKILRSSSSLINGFYCGAGLKSKDRHFQKILKDHPDAQIISVGDEIRDYEAASKWRITHINVTWGYASKEAFDGLETVDKFEDLEYGILRYFNIEG